MSFEGYLVFLFLPFFKKKTYLSSPHVVWSDQYDYGPKGSKSTTVDRMTITLRTNSTYEGHNKDNDWSQATSILRSFVLPWFNWGLQSTIICRFGTVCTLLKMQRCHSRAILKEHHEPFFLSFKNFSTKRTLQWNTWMFTFFQGTTYTNMIPLFLRVYRKRSINQN